MTEDAQEQKPGLFYKDEATYLTRRLYTLFGLTLLSFIFSHVPAFGIYKEQLTSMGFILIIYLFLSLLHYIFVQKFPHKTLFPRKAILIVSDIVLLTYAIILFGKNGIFLYLFYILIVTGSGLRFGTLYFYIGIAASALSWIFLLFYSPYWQNHSDYVATFAIITFVIPLFYLDYIVQVNNERDDLRDILDYTQNEMHIDPLTDIPNRKAFEHLLASSLTEQKTFALLFLDLNKFKEINDTYGHHIGDAVLQKLAQELQLRVGENDFCARLGGDEFVVLIFRKHTSVKAFVLHLENNFIGRHVIQGIPLNLSLSIGISLCPEDAKTRRALLEHADKAMYVAKNDPSTYHCFYQDIKTSSYLQEKHT